MTIHLWLPFEIDLDYGQLNLLSHTKVLNIQKGHLKVLTKCPSMESHHNIKLHCDFDRQTLHNLNL